MTASVLIVDCHLCQLAFERFAKEREIVFSDRRALLLQPLEQFVRSRCFGIHFMSLSLIAMPNKSLDLTAIPADGSIGNVSGCFIRYMRGRSAPSLGIAATSSSYIHVLY